MEYLFFTLLVFVWLVGARSVAREKFIAGLFEKYGSTEIDDGREFRWGLFVWRGSDDRWRRSSGFTVMSADEEGLALKNMFPISLWLHCAFIPWTETIYKGRRLLLTGFGRFAVIQLKNGPAGEILIPIKFYPSDSIGGKTDASADTNDERDLCKRKHCKRLMPIDRWLFVSSQSHQQA